MTQGITQVIELQRWSVKFIIIVIIKVAIYPKRSRYLRVIQDLYARDRAEAALFTSLPMKPVATVQKMQVYQPPSKRSFTAPPSSRKPRHHTNNPSTAH